MVRDNTPGSLFGCDLDEFTSWKQEWKDMPEFEQHDIGPYQSIEIEFEEYFEKGGKLRRNRIIFVHFTCRENVKEFASLFNINGVNYDTKYLKLEIKKFISLINQKINPETKSIWFPDDDRERPSSFVYTQKGEYHNPKYPIYVISKGRWESRLTVKALEAMKVPYHVVIEPQEYNQYASVIDKDKIYVLPFSNLGQGGIPARNWVFEHAVASGAKRHWILDDNIDGFIRLNRNRKIKVDSGVTFKCIEDFVDRYSNVAMAGMDYRYFAPERSRMAAYTLNTRIYSCILLNNELPHRWRGKYNEDTDLSLRFLKDGYATLLFKAFLCNKVGTLKMKGGNTDTVYNTDDNRLLFAKSLEEQHPDVVKVVWRYERWHHEVDYSSFLKNKLQKKSDLNIQDRVNNYGMVLTQL